MFAVGRFNKFSKCFAHCLVFSFVSEINFSFSSLTVFKKKEDDLERPQFASVASDKGFILS